MSLISQNKKNLIFEYSIRSLSLLVKVVVFFIFIYLFKESLPFLQKLQNLRLEQSWFPSEGQFNFVPILLGTFVSSLLALLFAVPLGIALSLYIVFYSSDVITNFLISMIKLYASLPSVIFGLWGLMNFVPIIAKLSPPGQNLLTASLILSLMIFPLITLNLVETFNKKNNQYKEVTKSLSLKPETIIWKIILPTNKEGIISSSLLALGRALGETMAVVMVCGNIPNYPIALLQPIRTLTANIALEMSYAMGLHRSALFFSGFVLLILTTVIMLYVTKRKPHLR